eukprot:3963811-Pleurochrysis_carterae.AAC.1
MHFKFVLHEVNDIEQQDKCIRKLIVKESLQLDSRRALIIICVQPLPLHLFCALVVALLPRIAASELRSRGGSPQLSWGGAVTEGSRLRK